MSSRPIGGLNVMESTEGEGTMTQASGYAPVNGLNMYYEVHGTGRPLVLMHGGLHTIDLSFGQVLPGLAASRRAIGVELQGHGHTADIHRPFTLVGLADDIVGLLDLLGIERADVFGFSLGGLVATQLAVTRPERVDRVVLAASHFHPDGYYDDIRDPALFATSTRMPTEQDFAAMREAYERVAPDPAHFTDFAEKVSTAVGTFTGWSADELGSIKTPTLIMVGDNDFVRVEHAAEMRDLIPDSRLAVLPDTTHIQLTQRAELVVPIVERFLDQGR
jgi:pimeloyl-ACP methyl ester carboxylesterase